MIAYSCRRAAELASRELNSPIRLDQKIELRFHRLICSACRRFGRQLKAIDQSFGEFIEKESDLGIDLMSEESKKRVKAILKNEIKEENPGDNNPPPERMR